ncbi:MAG: nitronate monooxygenase [Pseudomonadota bacterium]
MHLVSGPRLVTEACKAGIIGALPVQNAQGFERLESWLTGIRDALDRHTEGGGTHVGALAMNLNAKFPDDEVDRHLALFRRTGVRLLITVGGDPTALIARAHDAGFLVFHDITSLRFAEKAIGAGADGLICIGAGGGGHSGTISHLSLLRTLRAQYGGALVLAGAVSDGATVRAAEVLGADFAYMGTRFIATAESDAPQDYKDLLVSQTSADLAYTGKITGVPANWLVASVRRAGIDLDGIPELPGVRRRHDHLPEHARPWKNIWSAGQGIDLIHDIPTVADLVLRLRREYVAACRTPDMAPSAALD